MNEAHTPASVGLPWGVAALLLATGDALTARFGAVAVRGEISGFSRAASGHCYFSLKDAGGASALLRCAMFRRSASLLDFSPADGQQVDIRGRLGVYEPRGELQMVAEAMQRVGSGALFEEFLRLRARLQGLGLFEPTRKRPIARYPQGVGVVTSLGAAALHDVLTALQRRAPHVRVVIYPALVQGAQAPAALVAALAQAAIRREVDTVLLVRGGGSLEDLWAFNDERVVRAVAEFPLPLVCGVGHETDVTLCDLAADLRAPTPTAAAELAAPAQAEMLLVLAHNAAALSRSLVRFLQRQAQSLDTLALRLGQPGRVLSGQTENLKAVQLRVRWALARTLSRQQEQLAQRAQRLARAMQSQLQTHRLGLSGVQGRLDALSPAHVLKRGYAWVQASDGRPVVSVAALQRGQAVVAVWTDGTAGLRVDSITSQT